MSCEEIVVQPWLHWQLADGCEGVLDSGDKGQELGLPMVRRE